jgi:hypothetical protein
MKRILSGIRDVLAPSGPPIFLVAIIFFLAAIIASIYLSSIGSSLPSSEAALSSWG